MKLTKLFTTLTIDKNDLHYVFFEDMCNFLTQKRCNIRDIGKNIIRTLQLYEGTIEKIGEKEIISVNSLLRYCFNNQDKSNKCKDLCSDILCQLIETKNTTETVVSGLDLYRNIAKANFTANFLLLDNVNLDEHSIQSLLHDYKDKFDKKEWQNIVLFEHHFSAELGSRVDDLDYDEQLNLKVIFFQNLVDLYEKSRRLHRTSSHNLRKIIQRIKIKDDKEKVQLHTKKLHIPSIIEEEIIGSIKDCGIESVINVICYDCLGLERNKNCIEAVCVLDANLCGDVDETCLGIFNSVRRRHEVNVRKIYFIKNEFLECYKEDDVLSRYCLREALQCKEIRDIAHEWDAGYLASLDKKQLSDGEENCEVCGFNSELKPLEMSTFDILKEWYVETPLEIQLLLCSFINKESVKRAPNLEQYYKDKLKKVYIIFDSLLNVMNRQYMGIFQNKSTNELLIEYKSLKSVFNVTSELGSTFSLTTGEKNLKKLTEPDQCNYRTYLKPYEIPYETVDGGKCEYVRLSKCHVILMLDNLVRLTYVADPNPGEKRSNQLCTLPITIQGLPLDHIIVKEWHLHGCDRQENCNCKQKEKLTKSDLDRVLVELNTREKSVLQQFSKLMTWGQLQLWRELPDEIWEVMVINDEHDSIQESKEIGFSPLRLTCDQVVETPEQEEIDNLEDIISNVIPEVVSLELLEESISDVLMDKEELSELEISMDHLSILEPEENSSHEESNSSTLDLELLSSFGFIKYVVPQLLCRHPPPAVGRDDDISKIAEILDNVMSKMGYNSDPQKRVNRILCGPDNKIGSNLMKLMETNRKYECFLPEFPCCILESHKLLFCSVHIVMQV